MSAQPAGLPRLLLGASSGRPGTLEEHLHHHGPLPEIGEGDRLLGEVERAGLRGRGGAGFPIATKMRAVRQEQRRAIVVANGAEGEPTSAKDRVLLETVPHLVIDGADVAAQTVGAAEILICLPADARSAQRALETALRERDHHDPLPVAVRIEEVPHRFLSGEETALISHLNGGPGKPTAVPPRPAQRGVARRPTLVNNVETLAHLALVARHGADWFRSLGTEEEPGSRLVTLSGAIARPGVYEIAAGTGMEVVLQGAGGTHQRIGGVLCGGYFGTWLAPGVLPSVTFDALSLGRFGAAPGAGAIAVLPADACGVAETARIVRYLSEESAGQCGPCVHGLAAIADALARLASGHSDGHDAARLARWCAQVRGRGACHHPDGAVRLVASALSVYGPEVALHAEGRCSATHREPILPIPATGRRRAWAA